MIAPQVAQQKEAGSLPVGVRLAIQIFQNAFPYLATLFVQRCFESAHTVPNSLIDSGAESINGFSRSAD
jgi:hypothetical protein